MIKFSNDVETELRTSVVQAREVEPGKYGEMQNNVNSVNSKYFRSSLTTLQFYEDANLIRFKWFSNKKYSLFNKHIDTVQIKLAGGGGTPSLDTSLVLQ